MRMTLPDYEGAKAYALGRLERELAAALTYHSLAHTRDEVLPAAEALAADAGVSGEALMLLRTAAVFHDIGFVTQREGHEAAGVSIAQAVLPGFGYRPGQMAVVGDMVMATRLPQSPRTVLESILADADLDLLGREAYWTRHLDLRAEWAAFGLWMTDLEWYQNQLSFLRGHTYFSLFARQRRDPRKQDNIRRLEAKIAECDDGGGHQPRLR